MHELTKRYEKIRAYEQTDNFKNNGESYGDYIRRIRREKEEKLRRIVERASYKRSFEQRRTEALKLPIYSENSGLAIKQRNVWKSLSLTEHMVRLHKIPFQSNKNCC